MEVISKFEKEKLKEYLGYLKIRAQNRRADGKEFEALEIEQIIYELAHRFDMEEFL